MLIIGIGIENKRDIFLSRECLVNIARGHFISGCLSLVKAKLGLQLPGGATEILSIRYKSSRKEKWWNLFQEVYPWSWLWNEVLNVQIKSSGMHNSTGSKIYVC